MNSQAQGSPSAVNSRAWLLLHSGDGDYAWNMALDEGLLGAMPCLCRPALRFYGWTERAASFGYFQKITEIERLTLLRPLVRRPTGGGLVPHDADWTYSLAFPPDHAWYALKATESYRQIHEWIQAAFIQLNVATELAPCCRKAAPGQCFLGYEQSDVLWHGRKIAGAAQRRTRNGLLIQGSIQPPPLLCSRQEWEKAMISISSRFGCDQWIQFAPDEELHERATELAIRKYSQAAYNQKR